MKLDKYKLELAMANKCYTKTRLVANAGICYSSLIKILNGKMKLTPQTLGKIAKTLDVKPVELLKDEA
ncbi:helix-turn-helix domain-containing protein [Megamonas funiformis]|uniref:helix-turn-helix domain-containing protein n=1 Tax=Megamonas funiformis TaxID=437897 RepID=UPI00399A7D41